jgi:hypothetical protein
MPIILWLACLPLDIYEKAVANNKKQWLEFNGNPDDNNLLEECSTFRDAVSFSCSWDNTPEGFDYWYLISRLKL